MTDHTLPHLPAARAGAEADDAVRWVARSHGRLPCGNTGEEVVTAIRLASQTPDFFALNGDAAVRCGEGFGCRCANCDRQISAPFGYERNLIWCLYCGMEHGHVPMVEQPIGSFRWGFGVTREECVEDITALADGTFDDLWERRARRYDHIWDIF